MSKPGDKHWTAQQIEYLRAEYPSTHDLDGLSRLVGKTPDSIRTKAHRLGIEKVNDIVPDGCKRCPHCKAIKSTAEFYKDQAWCKSCMMESRRTWGVQNRKRLAAYRYVRVARNPEHMQAVAARGSHKARAPIKVGHDLTEEQWRDIIYAHNNICPMCHQPFTAANPATRDCIIPLSKGGRLTASNVQPLHMECNNQKGAQHG